MLEPGAGYDFQARTRVVGGATSPYGDLLTRTLAPAVPAPSQPPPFVAAPAVPSIDIGGDVELLIHYPPPNQPTTYDYWQTEIALASGGPTSWTLVHYGAIGAFKAPAAGAYYLRYREVSKYSSGGVRVASPWQPATGYQGPFTLAVGPGFDTTPPNPPTDLAVPFNGYVTLGGQTQQQTHFRWNGEVGVPQTYGYSEDFGRFELRIEGLTSAADTVFQSTSRQAFFIATNLLRPTHQYRMAVRAWDTRGNATDWTLGPTFTVPAPAAPPGGTTVTIVAMGYNAAALRLAYTPASADEALPTGFSLHSAPWGFGEPAAPTYVPAMQSGAGGAVSVFQVVNPVTTDPPPTPPGGVLVGLEWAFRAEPVSAAGGIGGSSAWVHAPFTPVDGANLIVNSVHGNRVVANTIEVDRITATWTITGKTIQTAAAGNRVVLDFDRRQHLRAGAAPDRRRGRARRPPDRRRRRGGRAGPARQHRHAPPRADQRRRRRPPQAERRHPGVGQLGPGGLDRDPELAVRVPDARQRRGRPELAARPLRRHPARDGERHRRPDRRRRVSLRPGGGQREHPVVGLRGLRREGLLVGGGRGGDVDLLRGLGRRRRRPGRDAAGDEQQTVRPVGHRDRGGGDRRRAEGVRELERDDLVHRVLRIVLGLEGRP